ncbi:MAG: ribonuclease HII [Gemmatimonadales bacterium]
MTPASARPPSLRWERQAWAERRLLIGIDEVGRGPLAGPIVAAAVVFPPAFRRILGIRDSKMLVAAARERLAAQVRARAIAFGIGAASNREIDRLNIGAAGALAMRRALRRLFGVASAVPTEFGTLSSADAWHIVIDGRPLPDLAYPHVAIIDGDALCYSIAAASIIAKTVRDRIMRRLAPRHPAYCWDSNVGYSTREHLDGICRSGVTRHHRITFTPVAQHELWR